MAVNKVIYGNVTLVDLTADTVKQNKVLKDETFHENDGSIKTGTAGAMVSGSTLIIPSSQGSVSGSTLTLT